MKTHACHPNTCASKKCMQARFTNALKDDDLRRDFSHVNFMSSFKKPKLPSVADVARRYANHVETLEEPPVSANNDVGMRFSDEDDSFSDMDDQSSASSDVTGRNDISTDETTGKSNTENKNEEAETRRTKALQYFLEKVLDPNLEEIASLSRARPFCGVPGCEDLCDVQCMSCVGYYCEKHHVDPNQTHSTRVWNEELYHAKHIMLLPGFQDTSFIAKINSTPSFCSPCGAAETVVC